MISGEEIYRLIPQRPPIVMVDVLWHVDKSYAETGLTIQEDNIFVSDNVLREAGLIEHIAQSAAAFAGYDSFCEHRAPKVGYIGEIKKCSLLSLPEVGCDLRTSITLIAEAAGVKLIEGQTKVGNELIAECLMKIFLKSE